VSLLNNSEIRRRGIRFWRCGFREGSVYREKSRKTSLIDFIKGANDEFHHNRK